uniref:alpha-N-acetylgalactosaminide alpha-2,6-sialyltransferase n=1 Tax=Myotis lucifugus TaxID=59463 RepID=G1PE90_MYOLU
MRPHLRRLAHLGRAARWLLLLAGLIFLLFTLPAFVKEPNTKPTRHHRTEDITERSWPSLQETSPPTPPMDRRAPTHAGSTQESSTLDTRPEATGHSEATGHTEATGYTEAAGHTAPGTARTALFRSQGTTVGTPPPSSQAGGPAPPGTEAPRVLDARTSEGRRDKNEPPTAAGTAPAQPRAPTAGTPRLESRAEALTPTGAGSPTRETKGVTTETAAPRATPSRSPVAQTTPRLRAANFKAEPKWDFEEQYSLDVGGLQTTCPDSVKVRASKSLWLRHLFLPNLTLFLDSRHFNQSEWERLEHFAPPFGFMELNRSLVQEVVTRFPPVAQQQLLLAGLPAGSTQCVSCAVVGNGGILNDSHVGPEIDGHDYVFRLSGAVTKGYEQDVGTRTSFYGFTAFSLTQSLYQLGSRGFQHAPLGKDIRYLHFLEGTRDYEWLEALLLNRTVKEGSLFWFRHRPQVVFREALRLDQYLLLHPDLLRYMKNRFLRSRTLDTAHWRIYRPTTGALLLLTALQLCDKVSAYGFITEGHERFSDHYYDRSWKKTVFYINHDFALERTLWKRLHDEGIIRLYQRPPGPGGACNRG